MTVCDRFAREMAETEPSKTKHTKHADLLGPALLVTLPLRRHMCQAVSTQAPGACTCHLGLISSLNAAPRVGQRTAGGGASRPRCAAAAARSPTVRSRCHRQAPQVGPTWRHATCFSIKDQSQHHPRTGILRWTVSFHRPGYNGVQMPAVRCVLHDVRAATLARIHNAARGDYSCCLRREHLGTNTARDFSASSSRVCWCWHPPPLSYL